MYGHFPPPHQPYGYPGYGMPIPGMPQPMPNGPMQGMPSPGMPNYQQNMSQPMQNQGFNNHMQHQVNSGGLQVVPVDSTVQRDANANSEVTPAPKKPTEAHGNPSVEGGKGKDKDKEEYGRGSKYNQPATGTWDEVLTNMWCSDGDRRKSKWRCKFWCADIPSTTKFCCPWREECDYRRVAAILPPDDFSYDKYRAGDKGKGGGRGPSPNNDDNGRQRTAIYDPFNKGMSSACYIQPMRVPTEYKDDILSKNEAGEFKFRPVFVVSPLHDAVLNLVERLTLSDDEKAARLCGKMEDFLKSEGCEFAKEMRPAERRLSMRDSGADRRLSLGELADQNKAKNQEAETIRQSVVKRELSIPVKSAEDEEEDLLAAREEKLRMLNQRIAEREVEREAMEKRVKRQQ